VDGRALRRDGTSLSLDERAIARDLDEAVHAYYEDVE
jgi:hypothetical protein